MITPFPPFHAGERAVQARAGVTERMAGRARAAIRDRMPDQHRLFFQERDFLLVASADRQGWPAASLLSGRPGFVTAPDDRQVRIAARPAPFDPLARNLETGAGIGLLGIDLATRRRNRMNGTVIDVGDWGFQARVEQSFGNCDKYIQTRALSRGEAANPPPAAAATPLRRIDVDATALIARADTFFVASCAPRPDGSGFDCDMSHRGGRPGFMAVDGDVVTIPDFLGNFYFNTFGNFHLNPKAGLLIPDFTTGDLLLLQGQVEMLWDDPRIQAVGGAQRAWRVHVTSGLAVAHGAHPLKGALRAYSPATLGTGIWPETASRPAP